MRGLARLIWYLILLGLFVAAAVWIANHPGSVTMEWLGWRITTSMAMLVLVVVVALAMAGLALWVLNTIRRLPRRMARRLADRRQQAGMHALADGLAAAAVGEAKKAVQLARVAERKLSNPAVTAVLTAQAAQLAGDDQRANDQFRTLLARPETAALGLRGLLRQALDSNDRTRAIELARQARQSASADPWTADTLFDLLVKTGRLEEAEALIEDAERSGAMPASLAGHRRALVLNERAGQALAINDSRAALAFARRAVAADASFPAAAARLATLYTAGDRRRRADGVLAKAWQHRQSPDLLRAVADESPLVRLYRLERMVDDGPANADVALALGETALDAKLWGQARKHFLAALALRPSARAYRLLAKLEEAEYSNRGAVQAWLDKIAQAPGDPAWVCGSCHGTAADWTLLCPHCGEIDTLSWPVGALAAESEKAEIEPIAIAS